jgi:Flp pilus assembly protein TadG
MHKLKIFRRLAKAQEAVIAVEFALIAPVLLLIFFATFEVARAIDCRTRVVDAGSTAADLVAQTSSVTTTSLDNIYAAAQAIVYPYDTSAVKIAITSIKADGTTLTITNGSSNYCTAVSTTCVEWNYTKNGATVASSATIPSGLSSGQGIIMVKITYAYTSPTTQFLTNTITMSQTTYAIARSGAAITCTNC